jgi:hypothetical protein
LLWRRNQLQVAFRFFLTSENFAGAKMEILFCCFYFVILRVLILKMLDFDSTSCLYVGHCLHNLFSLPAPTLATSFRGVQAIFRAKHFHVYVYPIFSTAVTHTYSPMKMEQTECSETLAFKLRTSEITQKKAYDILPLILRQN